jgi:ketosteroid isomerase-like protein
MADRPGVSRPLLDTLFLRVPGLAAGFIAVLRRLRPGSLARRRLLQWSLRRSYDAYERWDVEFGNLIYEPDVEMVLEGVEGMGLASRYSGHEGWRQYLGDLSDTFEAPRLTVKRLLDGGDRIAFIFEWEARGKASGVRTKVEVASGVRFGPRGRVTRQALSWNGTWGQALETAGLSEDA